MLAEMTLYFTTVPGYSGPVCRAAKPLLVFSGGPYDQDRRSSSPPCQQEVDVRHSTPQSRTGSWMWPICWG